MRLIAAVFIAALLFVPAAHAKKFRYSSGPKPPADTALSVAQTSMEPVVSENGPKVAPTNLDLVSLVANTAVERALASAPLDSGTRVILAPADSHPLNFVIEYGALRALARRGITTTVRHSIIPDDSLALVGSTGDPVLEYQLATARITYLRLIGGYILPSRVKVERQALVEARLTLRDPAGSHVLWLSDASHNLVDVFPRSQIRRVEDDRYADLKSEIPERNFGRLLEPVVVVAVVAGLVVLFFQNRP